MHLGKLLRAALQIDTGLASWKDCITVHGMSGASGDGVDAVMQHITEALPKWSSFIPRWQLSSWRHRVATAGVLQQVSCRPPTLLTANLQCAVI